MASQYPEPIVIGVDKPKFHILSTALILVWMIVVGGTVALLERAVFISHQQATIPWHLSTNGLPSLLITLIAQAHTPVTAMHLARLAVSTLSTSAGRPRTWIELFWMADRKWAGPVGMAEVIWLMIKLQFFRISITFCFFSVTILSSLALPVVLQRAYLAKTFDIGIEEKVHISTFASTSLAQVDLYAQIAAGGGAWATGQSVVALFNRSSYLPAGTPRGDPLKDVFFAGDVQSRDARLPGVLVQGGCYDLGIVTDTVEAVADADDAFKQLCEKHNIGDHPTLTQILPDFNLRYCSDVDPLTSTWPKSLAKKHIMLLRYSSPFINATGGDDRVYLSTGAIRCEVRTLFGRAHLNGRDLSYTDFREDLSIFRQDHSSDPIRCPLAAAVWILTKNAEVANNMADEIVSFITKAQLGYTELTGLGNSRIPPTPQQFAEMMWNGATHMAASLSMLSRTSSIGYQTVAYVTVTGYERNFKFLYVAIGLLGFWAVALLSTTILFLRRTFNDNINSYVATQLLLQRPNLFSGVPAGLLEENKKLLEQLTRVEFTHWRRAVGPYPLVADSGILLYV